MKIERGVKQGCVFLLYLLKLYSKMILRELKNLPGIYYLLSVDIIIGLEDSVLMIGSEGKLKAVLNKIVKENKKKKGLTINHRKTMTIYGCQQEKIAKQNEGKRSRRDGKFEWMAE